MENKPNDVDNMVETDQPLNGQKEPQKPYRTLSILLGVLVIFLLALVGILWYSLDNQTPNLSETENLIIEDTTEDQSDDTGTFELETYVNQEFGFEFDYSVSQEWILKENCSELFDKPSCYINLNNGDQNLVIWVNNPGSGGYGIEGETREEAIKIGDVDTTYRFGQAAQPGETLKDTYVMLINFERKNQDYSISFSYTGTNPDLVREFSMLSIIESIRFN